MSPYSTGSCRRHTAADVQEAWVESRSGWLKVAEMRPFLLEGITGVKKHSYKLIFLLRFLFRLAMIRSCVVNCCTAHKGRP